MIYDSITGKAGKRKQLALLIDPGKTGDDTLVRAVESANRADVDYILVGGSLVSAPVDPIIELVKKQTSIPVILFPGSLLQISDRADAILFLSLVSGRNPDLLIGNHVIAAPLLKRSKMEVIPTAYMLIAGGDCTSVEYMSHSIPIPAGKTDIAVATALASEMLGFRLIYLEAGSGSVNPVPVDMIRGIRGNVALPLMVGGGIRDKETARGVYMSGADIIVVGNAVERNISLLDEIASLRGTFPE